MTIQNYPDDLDYVNAKLWYSRSKFSVGELSFLDCFLMACLHADDENYELLRPVLLELGKKYPADAERVVMERHDSGRSVTKVPL